MKIILLLFFALISISVQAELVNWKPRRIPTTAEVQKNPLIPLSNLFMIHLESTFKISVSVDSSFVAACD